MKQYDSGVLTDEYAKEVIEGYFDVKGDMLRTRKKYVRKFGKILPMLKVARFYQLENKINAEFDSELAYVEQWVEARLSRMLSCPARNLYAKTCVGCVGWGKRLGFWVVEVNTGAADCQHEGHRSSKSSGN